MFAFMHWLPPDPEKPYTGAVGTLISFDLDLLAPWDVRGAGHCTVGLPPHCMQQLVYF